MLRNLMTPRHCYLTQGTKPMRTRFHSEYFPGRKHALMQYYDDEVMPGVNKSNVDLTVDNTGILHIHAKKESVTTNGPLQLKEDEKVLTVMDRVESEMKYYILERCADNLNRKILLPANADREFIKAKFTDGSLRISIPKYDGYQKQKIDIE